MRSCEDGVSLKRRLGRLEDGRGGLCPECGHDPDAAVRYVICWEGEESAPKESSELCYHCGFQSVLALDWDDAPPLQHPDTLGPYDYGEARDEDGNPLAPDFVPAESSERGGS
jgi:hypothetical protein